jgi:hypothetical protein
VHSASCDSVLALQEADDERISNTFVYLCARCSCHCYEFETHAAGNTFLVVWGQAIEIVYIGVVNILTMTL